MDTVAEELLSQIPKGEELKDPRAGTHENVVLKEAKLSDDRSAVVLTFTGLVDQEGHPFDYPHRVQFPTRTSEDWVKRQFLATLHDIGAVPIEDKSARYVETPAVADAVLSLFSGFTGTSYNIKLSESKSGFMNLRFLRTKKR